MKLKDTVFTPVEGTTAFPCGAIFVGSLVSLIVGDRMMMGESSERQRALATATAIRNIAVAFLIANQSFPGTSAAPTTTVADAAKQRCPTCCGTA